MTATTATTTTIRLRVRYFASLREALGPGEEVDLAADAGGAPADVAALRRLLVARGGRHAEVLAPGRAVRCAIDRVMSDETAPLRDGAEVAFFPPVTGG
jgi:molybdopterin synthase sulfur carrier subunit